MSSPDLLQERSLTYDCPDMPPPSEGDYLVSIGKQRKPGTVYQVLEVCKVNGKHPARYRLKVFKVPGMLSKVCVDFRFNVTVDGIESYPLFWHSRNKK